MKKSPFLAVLFILLIIIGACGAAEENYQPINPSEYQLNLELKGNLRWDKEGNITESPTIAAFMVNEQKIELLSDKIENNFISTKGYGKIKITGGPKGLKLYLTPSQKIALKKLLKAK